jgi:potassium-dependent mechanosensitive channel
MTRPAALRWMQSPRWVDTPRPASVNLCAMILRLLSCAPGLLFRALVAAALALAGMTGAPAQQPPVLPPAPDSAPALPAASAAIALETIKTATDDIENSLHTGAQTEDGLTGLKQRLVRLRDQLRDRLDQLDPRLKQIDQRLTQLGPPPDSAGTEDAAITAERLRLGSQRGTIESAIKQATLLDDRALDLDDRINQRRRELFTSRLFARSAGLIDAAFWKDLAESVPAELAGLYGLARLWAAHARSNGGVSGAVAALAILAALGSAAWFAARWWRRLIAVPTPRRFDKALVALVILGTNTVTAAAVVAAIVLVLRNFGLMPYPVVDIGFGLAAALAVVGFGRGVAIALFAPGAPERRIIAFEDREAVTYAAHLIWAARVFGVAVFLNAIHRALGSAVAPVIATGELLAFAILGITIHLLWRSAQEDFRAAGDRAVHPWRSWFRDIFWLVGIAIATALATGYAGFAVFLAGRTLATVVLGGAVTIAVVFIDALLTELLSADTAYGRRIAVTFGLTPRGLDLVETLASAILRLVLVVLAALLVLSFSGIFAEDFFEVFQRATWDYVIGGVSLSPVSILSALAFLVFGGLAIRGAQRWLATKFLPRTGLDAGLQNSILALFGYAALIAVVALSLGALGVDLQKIALIAGALSVGIGFGLQAVVSNFISGLILLAERSIRVGDWVVVKGEEGWVRRISIRATQIETFDRASVIIPNQEFITGVVKNWTHGNTVGRIIIKVRVAYESDVAKVRELLLACATRHPQVLQTTPPAVYLTGLGDIGIDFELRCLLVNIEQSFIVRNDLYMEVLRHFHDAGIKIPFPAHDVGVAGVPRAPLA